MLTGLPGSVKVLRHLLQLCCGKHAIWLFLELFTRASFAAIVYKFLVTHACFTLSSMFSEFLLRDTRKKQNEAMMPDLGRGGKGTSALSYFLAFTFSFFPNFNVLELVLERRVVYRDHSIPWLFARRSLVGIYFGSVFVCPSLHLAWSMLIGFFWVIELRFSEFCQGRERSGFSALGAVTVISAKRAVRLPEL